MNYYILRETNIVFHLKVNVVFQQKTKDTFSNIVQNELLQDSTVNKTLDNL